MTSNNSNANVFSLHAAPDVRAARESAELLLRDAIANKRVELHYQQQYCAQSGSMIGMEALARIRAADGQLISPDRFIGYAEQSGLIHQLGMMVIEQACTDLQNWRSEGQTVPRVAVNLSPVQFDDEAFASKALEVVNAHALDPADLQFEITEGRIINNLDATVRVCQQLAAAGVSLAMDDFGAGYSTLSRLSALPFDVLKLDKTFMAKVPNEAPANELLKAVLDMADCIGLEVVIEGVETEQQVAFLQRHTQVIMQGFGLHRPERNPLALADDMAISA